MVLSGVNSLLFICLICACVALCFIGVVALRKQHQNRLLTEQLNDQTQALEHKTTQFDQLDLNIAILTDIGNEITATLDFEQILNTLYLRVNQFMDASVFLIGLYNEQSRTIDFKLALENGKHQPLLAMSLDEKDRPAVWCIEHKQTMVIADYATEHSHYFPGSNIPSPKAGENTVSLIYCPLLVGTKVIGVLSVQSFAKNAYSKQHQDMIHYLASTTAIALDNAQAYLKVEQQKSALEQANEHVRVISEIGLKVNASLDLESIVLKLYDSVNGLMDAPIFGVGLFDSEKQQVNVLINVEYGIRSEPYTRDMTDPSLFAAWCINNRQTIYINDLDKQGRDYIVNHEYEGLSDIAQPSVAQSEIAHPRVPQSLIYIPLLNHNKVVGILSVQSCRKQAFEPVHVDVLTSLASFTTTAIENARMYQDLLVAQQHLETANKHIEVVSEIGRQVNASLDLDDVLYKIYNSVNSLMDAPVFGVGLFDQEKNHLDVRMAVEYGQRYKPYTRDMADKRQFPVWCIEHKKNIYINDLDKEGGHYIEDHEYLHRHRIPVELADGDKAKIPQSMIYIPLLIKKRVIGFLCVQSFKKQAFERVHVDILSSLASYTTTAIENAQIYQNLLDTQKQLVEAEKMASLGGLVAGVAHELNTPIGIGLTAATTMEYEIDKLSKAKKDQTLSKKSFELFEIAVKDGLGLLLQSLHRAGDLIHNFKSVAVDPSTEGLSCFTLDTLIMNVVETLQSKLIKANVILTVDCEKNWRATTYVNTLSQILINIILKSLEHGFNGIYQGHGSGLITIEVTRAGSHFKLRYTDNGRGIEQSLAKQIFEPFFTTNRGGGHTGLGMHVIFNYVTQQLGGTIDCHSDTNKGFELTIRFPACLASELESEPTPED